MTIYNDAVIETAQTMHDWLLNGTDDKTEDEFLKEIEQFGIDLARKYDTNVNIAHEDILTAYERLPGNLIDEMDDGTYPRMTQDNLDS
jgi:hypothetical protein